MTSFFDTKIEFLKGVGPTKASLLNKELNIFTFGDLIQHYPFRYEDRTKFYHISQINDQMPYIQLKGVIRHIELVGHTRKKRLHAYLIDGTGEVELVWFQGAQWVLKKLKKGPEYVVFGKPSLFNHRYNIAHPEIELLTEANENRQFLQPVYPTTEKLKGHFLDSKAISKLQHTLRTVALPHIRETLPDKVMTQFGLICKKEALEQIHFPESHNKLAQSTLSTQI